MTATGTKAVNIFDRPESLETEDAGGPARAVPARASISSWQAERLRRLSRICPSIDRRLASGQKLGRAIGWFVWYYRGRTYRSHPGRPLRFSFGSLRRAFYRWKASGADGLRLRYCCPRKRIDQAEVRRFALECLAPGVVWMRAGHRRLAGPRGSYHAYRHAMPAVMRRVVKAAHSARKTAARAEAQARSAIGRGSVTR